MASSANARFYDSDFTLMHELAAEDCLAIEVGTITLAVDSPTARWLYDLAAANTSTAVHVVARSPVSGRWSGVLKYWTVTKPSLCTECDHCQRPVFVTHWHIDPPPPPNVAIGVSSFGR